MFAEDNDQNIVDEIIDIEEHAKNDKKPPHAKKYKIRIDKEYFVVEVHELNGKQLLELAGKRPYEKYAIFQKMKHGHTEKIKYDQEVDFRTHGIERFITQKLDQTEG